MIALLVLVATFLFSEVSYAGNLDTDIYTWGGFDALLEGFRQSSTIHSNPEFNTVVTTIGVASLAWGGYQFGRGKVGPILTFVVGIIIYQGLAVPTSTVIVRDETLNRFTVVPGVSNAIVLPAMMLNNLERMFVEIVDSAGDPLGFKSMGPGTGPALLKALYFGPASAGNAFLDSDTDATLQTYISECVAFELARPGGTIKYDDFNNPPGNSFMGVLANAANPGITTTITTGGVVTPSTCDASWAQLAVSLNNMATFTALLKPLCDQNKYSSGDAGSLANCTTALNNIIQGMILKAPGFDASQFMRENILADRIVNALAALDMKGIANQQYTTSVLGQYGFSDDWVKYYQDTLFTLAIVIGTLLLVFIPSPFGPKIMAGVVGLMVLPVTWVIIDALLNNYVMGQAVKMFADVATGTISLEGLMTHPDRSAHIMLTWATMRAGGGMIAMTVAGFFAVQTHAAVTWISNFGGASDRYGSVAGRETFDPGVRGQRMRSLVDGAGNQEAIQREGFGNAVAMTNVGYSAQIQTATQGRQEAARRGLIRDTDDVGGYSRTMGANRAGADVGSVAGMGKDAKSILGNSSKTAETNSQGNLGNATGTREAATAIGTDVQSMKANTAANEASGGLARADTFGADTKAIAKDSYNFNKQGQLVAIGGIEGKEKAAIEAGYTNIDGTPDLKHQASHQAVQQNTQADAQAQRNKAFGKMYDMDEMQTNNLLQNRSFDAVTAKKFREKGFKNVQEGDVLGAMTVSGNGKIASLDHSRRTAVNLAGGTLTYHNAEMRMHSGADGNPTGIEVVAQASKGEILQSATYEEKMHGGGHETASSKQMREMAANMKPGQTAEVSISGKDANSISNVRLTQGTAATYTDTGMADTSGQERSGQSSFVDRTNVERLDTLGGTSEKHYAKIGGNNVLVSGRENNTVQSVAVDGKGVTTSTSNPTTGKAALVRHEGGEQDTQHVNAKVIETGTTVRGSVTNSAIGNIFGEAAADNAALISQAAGEVAGAIGTVGQIKRGPGEISAGQVKTAVAGAAIGVVAGGAVVAAKHAADGQQPPEASHHQAKPAEHPGTATGHSGHNVPPPAAGHHHAAETHPAKHYKHPAGHKSTGQKKAEDIPTDSPPPRKPDSETWSI